MPTPPTLARAPLTSGLDAYAIEELTAALIAAQRPCVILGPDVTGPDIAARGAMQAAQAFCRKLNLPAYAPGLDAPGLYSRSWPHAAAHADLFIVLGTADTPATAPTRRIAGHYAAVMAAILEATAHVEEDGSPERDAWLHALKAAER